MGENLWTSHKGSDQCHQKPIWFYAREIDYWGNFLDKATYEEIQGTKERHSSGLHWPGKGQWQNAEECHVVGLAKAQSLNKVH
jgi:hypothetical protein